VGEGRGKHVLEIRHQAALEEPGQAVALGLAEGRTVRYVARQECTA
jgi:hypothetical protein